MLLVSAEDVRRLLTPERALASQERAFASLARGESDLADKVLLAGEPGGASTLVYAARGRPGAPAAVKLVSVSEGNADRGLPTIVATVFLVDAQTGIVSAMIDGTSLTTVRTAAASALSVKLLARDDARVLAVLGSGVQARAHVRAVAGVRELERVRIWSPNPGHRDAAVAELVAAGHAAEPATSAQEAVGGADIVCACTHSAEPVVQGAWLTPGCHVVSVGSYLPDRSEVDDELVARAAVVCVDDRYAALHHAGSVMGPVERGVLDPVRLVTLGELVIGAEAARSSPEQVTFFNSIGLGVQDAAAAEVVVGLMG